LVDRDGRRAVHFFEKRDLQTLGGIAVGAGTAAVKGFVGFWSLAAEGLTVSTWAAATGDIEPAREFSNQVIDKSARSLNAWWANLKYGVGNPGELFDFAMGMDPAAYGRVVGESLWEWNGLLTPAKEVSKIRTARARKSVQESLHPFLDDVQRMVVNDKLLRREPMMMNEPPPLPVPITAPTVGQMITSAVEEAVGLLESDSSARAAETAGSVVDYLLDPEAGEKALHRAKEASEFAKVDVSIRRMKKSEEAWPQWLKEWMGRGESSSAEQEGGAK
jgi:hypothetical protein